MVTRDSQYPEWDLKAESSEADKLYIASPYDRVAAAVIDYFIVLMPVLYLVAAPFQKRIKEAAMISNNVDLTLAVIGAVGAAVSVVLTYQTVSIWLWQATLGKFLVGLRVINVWTRKAPSLADAFFRALIWVGTFLLLGLPFLATFSNRLRRPLHDRLSDSMVVSAERTKAALMPGPQENAFVASFYWVAGLAFTAIVGIFLSDLLVSLRREASLIATLEKDEVLCQAIGDATEDWPEEYSSEAPRLSVALGLYFSGELDRQCLEAELENLHQTDESGLAYLARSLVYEGHQELADRYMDRVCETDLDSEECSLIQARTALQEEEWAAFRHILGQLFKTERLYISIWATRELVNNHEFGIAEKFLTKIPPISALANFVTPSRTKILWGLHRTKEALGIESIAYGGIGLAARVDLSSWLCFEQIWNDCSKVKASSCRVFAEAADKYDDVLSDFTASLAYLRKWECEGDGERNYSELLRVGFHPEVLGLIEVLAGDGTKGFGQLIEDESQSDAMEAEIHRRIVERTKSQSLLKLMTEEWSNRRHTLYWEKVGLTLVQRWYQIKDYHTALEIGDRLRQNLAAEPLDSSTLEALVLAAYHTGQKGRARGLLTEYLASHPLPMSVQSSRAPASERDLWNVVRELILNEDQQ